MTKVSCCRLKSELEPRNLLNEGVHVIERLRGECFFKACIALSDVFSCVACVSDRFWDACEFEIAIFLIIHFKTLFIKLKLRKKRDFAKLHRFSENSQRLKVSFVDYHSCSVYEPWRLEILESFASNVLREINSLIKCCSSFNRRLYHFTND